MVEEWVEGKKSGLENLGSNVRVPNYPGQDTSSPCTGLCTVAGGWYTRAH